jgi:hypothetical protein
LEGESGLPDQLASLLRIALRDEAYADGIKAIIADNKERQARLEARAEKMRAIVKWAMGEASIPKLTAPDLTASVSAGRAPLEITNDVSVIPDAFCRIKREPDKTAIRKALEDGEMLPWAVLGNPQPTLRITKK